MMGNWWSLYYGNPAGTPHPLNEPSFDPLLGFPNGRKPRVMQVSHEELESAKIPLEDRDYCSHLLLKYRACRADVWPFLYKCGHEKHEYLHCEYEDYLLRMKEYERERRLLQRKQRLESRGVEA